MPTTTDRNGQRMTAGEWVRYYGSYTPAYGQLGEITTVHPDLTMDITIGGGAANLHHVRRASVQHAPNKGRP